MTLIGIKLDNHRNIIGYTYEDFASYQSDSDGWIVVENNPPFKTSEKFNWTIRQSDNVLVHKSTGLTPEEESQKSATEMTNILMGNAKDIEDIKQSITALTSMQLGGN